MKTTNSFQQLSEITRRDDARNYWSAIIDSMTQIMELEKRNERVTRWKYPEENDKSILRIFFDTNKTEETMLNQICKYAGIDSRDIEIADDEKWGKSLFIQCGKYDKEPLEVAESIANLYGYCVPNDERYYNPFRMKELRHKQEEINDALQNDYEEEYVYLNETEIGKCKVRNLKGCIVELDETTKKMWKDKCLIKKGMSIRFGNQKKAAQIKCFRNTIDRLFHIDNAPYPENGRLLDFIFDTTLAKKIERFEEIQNTGKMNEEQIEAVAKALMTDDLSIIQGPAGTGKTTVIAEIVKRLLAKNSETRILIASQTNVAVDNAIERLVEDNSIIRPLRIGRPLKIKDDVRKYCYQVINDWVEVKTNETCAAENCCQRVEDEEETHFRARCRSKYMKKVNVFGATCCSSGMGSMRTAYNEVFNNSGYKEQPWFDVLIIDEASKATLLDMAIPMVMAKKIILIGDHKQLPPYCDKEKSQMMLGLVRKSNYINYMYDKKKKEMRPSQFERMITKAKELNSSIVTTLRTQYRMHEQIMKLSEPFYKEEGGLKCGIDSESRQHELEYGRFLNKNDHAIFLNIDGIEKRSGTSYLNEKEEEAIRKVVKALQMSARVLNKKEPEIGIISFYKPQAQKFEDVDGITAATVDKYQGAEKDIIILSTVRSEKLGFIEDRRRLNVALSRAKNLLIVVGKKELLQKNDDYRFVIENMKVVNYEDIERYL